MTTFLLARHAAHDWLGRGFAGRMPAVALNEAGRAQALELVVRLEGVAIDAIYCSPQPRTQQTAAPLARARGLAIAIDPGWDEVDLGAWQGRTFDDVRGDPAWTQWLEQRSSACPPGGEPFVGVAQRASEALRRLARRHPGQHVLVVSHGDVIKAAIASSIGLSLDRLESFDIAPASISVLAQGESWARLHLLNALGPLR